MDNRQRFVPQDVRSRHQEEAVLPSDADQSVLHETAERIDRALESSSELVEIISGANSQRFRVAGRMLGDVRTTLQVIMNIGPDATALVNGATAPPDYVLSEDDTVEFVKEGGEKGGLFR